MKKVSYKYRNHLGGSHPEPLTDKLKKMLAKLDALPKEIVKMERKVLQVRVGTK